jgi:cell division septum initiation protein DivIVA
MPRGKRLAGPELVEQLNTVVAQLIKENRKLKRQVDTLTAKLTTRASGTVDRSLRAIQKRAQKALSAPARRRRRRTTATKRTTRKKSAA